MQPAAGGLQLLSSTVRSSTIASASASAILSSAGCRWMAPMLSNTVRSCTIASASASASAILFFLCRLPLDGSNAV